jgi:hypothetical protein
VCCVEGPAGGAVGPPASQAHTKKPCSPKAGFRFQGVRHIPGEPPQSFPLGEFDGGNRPPSFMATNGDSQPMQFIQPHFFDGPSLSIREDDGLTEKFGLGFLICAQDSGRVLLGRWHGNLGS